MDKNDFEIHIVDLDNMTEEEQTKLDRLLMDIHDASMSKVPQDAADGRVAKHLLPAYAQAMADEAKRKVELEVCYEAVNRALLAIHVSLMISLEHSVGARMPDTLVDNQIDRFAERLRDRFKTSDQRPPPIGTTTQ